MASLIARNVIHDDQENPTKGKAGAIVKKRTAAPLIRPGLGIVTNQRVPSKTVAPKQELRKAIREKTSDKSRPANVNGKDFSTRSSKVVKKDAKAEPMEMGTPGGKNKIGKNVSDGASKVENIDKDDHDNPQLCSEFVNDIYQYMLHLEASYPIKKHYLKQTALKSRMRTILVDWLIQVHHRFGLLQETLYLTIAILDRFLQLQSVPRTKLQLAGVTAMLIASKYEEMYAPEVNDFVYITDQAFSHNQILQMEICILKTLDFNLGRPLPLHFLRRNSKAGQVDAHQHTLAKYLMELSLVDYEMCHVPPSRLAAAALCLSTSLIGNEEWSATLQHYSSYSSEDLHPVVCHLAKNLKAAETSTYLSAIRTKYASAKAFKISRIEEVCSKKVSELSDESNTVSL